MPVGVGSTQVTGISSTTNASDVASKQYVDVSASGPSIVNQDNTFLTTDGNVPSWQPIGSYQEYTVAGTYTFNIPTHAKQFFIEATGAGGSGASGTRDASSYVNTGAGQWFLRTSGHTGQISGFYMGPSMIYVNNIFYAGTDSGAILASTDAITWITRTTGFGATSVGSIVYGNNLYVACGNSGKLITSTDTINWTMQTTGASTSRLNALVYNAGTYLLGLDNDARIFASTNGITWTLRTSGYPTGNAIYRILYDGNQYVASGGSGRFQTSTDSITWVIRTGVNNNFYTSVSYGNGLYFATSSVADIIVSTDAVSWVARTNVSYLNNLWATTFANNTYYIAGAGGFIIYSTDTVTWSFRTSPGAFASTWYGCVYGNNTFAIGGASGFIGAALPPLGFAGSGGGGGASASWNLSRAYVSGSILTVKVGKGGVYGSSGDSSTVSWTSPAGQATLTANGGQAGTNVYNTTTQSIPGGAGGTITASSNYLQASAGTAGGNGGIFEGLQTPSNATTATASFQTTGGGGGAVSNSNVNSALFYGSYGSLGGTINYYGNTASSTLDQRNMNGTSATAINGLSYGYGGNGGSSNSLGGSLWRLRTGGGGAQLYAAHYDGSNYLIGGGTYLAISTDSIVWVLRTSSYGANTIMGITYGNGVYVIGGNFGLRSSTDSINWSFRTSGTASQIGNTFAGGPSLIYQDGFFYGVGGSGALIVSTNAISWTLRTAGTLSTLYSIIYANNQYVLGATSGVINVSTNGIVWIARTSGISGLSPLVSSIAYGNGNYIAVNQSAGSVSNSTDAVTWIMRTLSNAPYSAVYGGGTYIASGANGWTFASVDAVTWHLRTSGTVTAGSVTGVCFGNNIFVLAHSGGDLIATTATKAGFGGDGVRGGGGGGGAYDGASNVPGLGGKGGDGYVRISWQ